MVIKNNPSKIALSDKILAKQDLEIIEKYCIWALFDKAGQKFHKAGTLFILPQKTVIENLIPKIEKRHRVGFDLTDNGCSALRASGEAHYCIFCHNQKKDSCKTGLIDKETQKIKIDGLGIKLEGCPLEEKISEMNFLKSGGFSLASLAMAIIDNPMIAGTGHRICNDCMKSCIYQKQDPVDIPQIESRILKDILNLPLTTEEYLELRYTILELVTKAINPVKYAILDCNQFPDHLLDRNFDKSCTHLLR
jgi:hypothetical protein